MIVETPVLVIDHDQETFLPDLRISAQCIVDGGNQPLAHAHIIRRVLVVRERNAGVAHIVVDEAGDDERVVGDVRRRDVGFEMLESRHQRARTRHLRQQQHFVDVGVIHPPRQALVHQAVVDRLAVEGLRRAVRRAAHRSRGVGIEPVRQRHAGNGREPVIAQHELLRQRPQHRQLLRREALHDGLDVVGRGVKGARIGSRLLQALDEGLDEAVIPGGMSRRRPASNTGQLRVGRLQRMRRPLGNRMTEKFVKRPILHEVLLGGRIERIGAVEFAAGQAFEFAQMSRARRKAEHVVESPVLQHEHDDVLDRRICGNRHRICPIACFGDIVVTTGHSIKDCITSRSSVWLGSP